MKILESSQTRALPRPRAPRPRARARRRPHCDTPARPPRSPQRAQARVREPDEAQDGDELRRARERAFEEKMFFGVTGRRAPHDEINRPNDSALTPAG
jgi:hypothetical protein